MWWSNGTDGETESKESALLVHVDDDDDVDDISCSDVNFKTEEISRFRLNKISYILSGLLREVHGIKWLKVMIQNLLWGYPPGDICQCLDPGKKTCKCCEYALFFLSYWILFYIFFASLSPIPKTTNLHSLPTFLLFFSVFLSFFFQFFFCFFPIFSPVYFCSSCFSFLSLFFSFLFFHRFFFICLFVCLFVLILQEFILSKQDVLTRWIPFRTHCLLSVIFLCCIVFSFLGIFFLYTITCSIFRYIFYDQEAKQIIIIIIIIIIKRGIYFRGFEKYLW